MDKFSVNEQVVCNGYPGTVIDVGTGQLAGMVIVRLERGCVCVSANAPDVIAVLDSNEIDNATACAYLRDNAA